MRMVPIVVLVLMGPLAACVTPEERLAEFETRAAGVLMGLGGYVGPVEPIEGEVRLQYAPRAPEVYKIHVSSNSPDSGHPALDQRVVREIRELPNGRLEFSEKILESDTMYGWGYSQRSWYQERRPVGSRTIIEIDSSGKRLDARILAGEMSFRSVPEKTSEDFSLAMKEIRLPAFPKETYSQNQTMGTVGNAASKIPLLKRPARYVLKGRVSCGIEMCWLLVIESDPSTAAEEAISHSMIKGHMTLTARGLMVRRRLEVHEHAFVYQGRMGDRTRSVLVMTYEGPWQGQDPKAAAIMPSPKM